MDELSRQERIHSKGFNIDSSFKTEFGKIKVGNNSFIGCNVTILRGVTIGNNCVIGAGSVVTKNVPDGEVWAGNPAKFIKKSKDLAQDYFNQHQSSEQQELYNYVKQKRAKK